MFWVKSPGTSRETSPPAGRDHPCRGRSPPGALAAAQRGSWRRDLPAGALGRACAKSRGETRAARAPAAVRGQHGAQGGRGVRRQAPAATRGPSGACSEHWRARRRGACRGLNAAGRW